MPFLQRLRLTPIVARAAVLWFTLAVLAAVASPMVNPQATQLICSGSGAMKVIVFTEDGAQEVSSSHTLDCPLCAALDTPPPAVVWSAVANPRPAAVSWYAALPCQGLAPALTPPSRAPPQAS